MRGRVVLFVALSLCGLCVCQEDLSARVASLESQIAAIKSSIDAKQGTVLTGQKQLEILYTKSADVETLLKSKEDILTGRQAQITENNKKIEKLQANINAEKLRIKRDEEAATSKQAAELTTLRKQRQQRTDENNRLTHTNNVMTQELVQLTSLVATRESQFKNAKEGLANTTHEVEVLKEALQAAQKVIEDPSLYDWFNAKLEFNTKSVPSLSSVLKKITTENVKKGLGKMRVRIQSRIESIPVLSPHSSAVSLALLYFFTLVPFVAFVWLLLRFSGIISLPHIQVLANVCLTVTVLVILIFAIAFKMPDPLSSVEDSTKFFHRVLAIIYLGCLFIHVFGFIGSPEGNTLAQLAIITLIGGHYYAQAWHPAVNNEPTLITPVFYAVYAALLVAAVVLSFRQLTHSQRLELESILANSRQELSEAVALDSDEGDEESAAVKSD